jgi:hypothetical protein
MCPPSACYYGVELISFRVRAERARGLQDFPSTELAISLRTCPITFCISLAMRNLAIGFRDKESRFEYRPVGALDDTLPYHEDYAS